MIPRVRQAFAFSPAFNVVLNRAGVFIGQIPGTCGGLNSDKSPNQNTTYQQGLKNRFIYFLHA